MVERQLKPRGIADGERLRSDYCATERKH